MGVFRCYTEKREEFNIEGKALLNELRNFLGITRLRSVRILIRYDVEGISQETYNAARNTVFSDPQTDDIYDEIPPDPGAGGMSLTVEAMPGQYDQRADSCAQCLQALPGHTDSGLSQLPAVNTAKMYIFNGDIDRGDMDILRGYLINPVESREAESGKPVTLAADHAAPGPVETLHGFISSSDDGLMNYRNEYGLAMDEADLRFMREYFRDTESRDPTVAELRVIDTYWSDHCRHSTFLTHFSDVKIDDPEVQDAYDAYRRARDEAYGDSSGDHPQTLMDIATIAAKTLRRRGLLGNVEVSEEVNACSVHINAVVDGKNEDWLLMFKNETHNHPTEVEPFGGAATCVGGAIRDPLSGRAFVYQAMRVTGAGDPLTAFTDTVPGKLPQRKLTRTAAQGNSSYGNQIGLAAGLVHEIYHPGYIAKRMELGAVVGAVKAENVRRETPAPGDKVILLGARTGRDGIGGATGSSKSQTGKSIVSMAAEVQKGNAPEERKIQRMFLDPEVTKMIKKCNDFGAGGVSVAVGELADGLDIDLSLVRCKYSGLDGTELAISESQERMAVVVAPGDVDRFIRKAEAENLEAYAIADVTESPRMVIRHENKVIVDLSRKFLSSNGAVKSISVHVPDPPAAVPGPGDVRDTKTAGDAEFADKLKALAGDLRFCSQRGLYEMFDGSAGALSVLMKNGGKTQSTPIQAMASLIPAGYDAAKHASTTTCSVMSYGYDPFLSSVNPFIGAKTAVATSVAKLVASGCDPDDVLLSFQEFFEDLRGDPARWGKPFSALLGAFQAQMELEIAAIGGKDSMSGSFQDIDVPPALVSFAIAACDAAHVISPEFKSAGNDVVAFEAGDDLSVTKTKWKYINSLIKDGTIISAWAVTEGGYAEGLFKMSLGNEIGFECSPGFDSDKAFAYSPGSIIAEITRPVTNAAVLGRTIAAPVIKIGGGEVSLGELKAIWESTLESIFPTKTDQSGDARKIECDKRPMSAAGNRFAKPRALVLSFPGSTGDIDAARAVSRAGGDPKILVVRNMTADMLAESIDAVDREIRESQILILPGGSSFGDEPDGAAKFIDVFFRVPRMTDAINEHLKTRGGLVLGISNGFQALVKLGLVPFGEIVAPASDRPALTRNAIGRHQAGYVYTRVASVNSPWMNMSNVGDVHAVAISHAEGRFVASDAAISQLAADGRIATQYSDIHGEPSMDISINPNGSMYAIEGLFSPDGRVFGKMGHTERSGENVAKNIYGDKHQPVFESGINYFR